jgi:4-hydroxy-tetrahydrodipicolinate synthase
MVTPFDGQGALAPDRAAELASHLVDLGNDGLVVNATTGEGPTTTDAEKSTVIRSVAAAVGDRATVVANVGTYDTAHSIELAKQASVAGAHGVMAVTPYYSRPPQSGLLAHFSAIADATDVPMMLYDIPTRSVVPIAVDTLLRLAEHPRIVAVKDAKGDLFAGSEVIANTDLAYYSGDDALNLPWLSIGGIGYVSVIGHVVANRLRSMLDYFEKGEVTNARTVHNGMLPVLRAFSRVGGVLFAKTALGLRGRDAGDPRLPLPHVTEEQLTAISTDLSEAGVPLEENPATDLRSARVAGHDARAAYIPTTTHTSAGQVPR